MVTAWSSSSAASCRSVSLSLQVWTHPETKHQNSRNGHDPDAGLHSCALCMMLPYDIVGADCWQPVTQVWGPKGLP